jgi:hypothetical protein
VIEVPLAEIGADGGEEFLRDRRQCGFRRSDLRGRLLGDADRRRQRHDGAERQRDQGAAPQTTR